MIPMMPTRSIVSLVLGLSCDEYLRNLTFRWYSSSFYNYPTGGQIPAMPMAAWGVVIRPVKTQACLPTCPLSCPLGKRNYSVERCASVRRIPLCGEYRGTRWDEREVELNEADPEVSYVQIHCEASQCEVCSGRSLSQRSVSTLLCAQ